jgi:hypothetical protein
MWEVIRAEKPGVEVTNTGHNGRDITLGLVMSFVQGGETLFPILVVSVGHGDGTGGKVGPHRNGLLGDWYHYDQCKERKSMG